MMSETGCEKRIMCVGLLVLDIVTVCDGYPTEDTDQRCIDQIWQRGGNASNSSTAISVIGDAPAEYVGVITDSKEHRFLHDDFELYGIHTENCVLLKGAKTPTSTILSNIRNGSRTILFCQRNLPEVMFDDFKSINLNVGKYKWIHFEGRPSVDQISKMLKHIDERNADPSTAADDIIKTSVELEKCRENLAQLFDTADVVFISKEYAQWNGCNSMVEAVEKLFVKCRPGATLICPWGDKGAAAITPDGNVVTSPAFPPDKVVDTLAAGDTFNASTITALSRGLSVKDAITFGCRIAGTKCGFRGWSELRENVKPIVNEMLKS